MFGVAQINREFEIKGFNSIYYFEFGKNFTHAPERHDFWEMVYVDSGSIVAITDGEGIPLSQGQIIFHQPGELHAHTSDTRVPNSMLVVSFTCDSPAMKFFAKKIFTLDKSTKVLLSLFIEETQNALGEIPNSYEWKEQLNFSNEKFGSTQLLSCFLTEFLIRLTRMKSAVESRALPIEKRRNIAQTSISEMIIDYMNDNVYQSLTLDDICKHFMLEKSQLTYIFKNNTGKTIIRYYNHLKIKEARRLLRKGENNISQISDMLGYSCIHAFTRAFKQAVGLSPSEYRKKVIVNEENV